MSVQQAHSISPAIIPIRLIRNEYSILLTTGGFASLKVYNILGQEVATLFSGVAKAGHSISATFNASGCASGIYFARLEYDGKSLVQRMLLTNNYDGIF